MRRAFKIKKEDDPPPLVEDYFTGCDNSGRDPYDLDRRPAKEIGRAAVKALEDALQKLQKTWKKRRL